MVRVQYASDLHINDWPEGTPFDTFLIPAGQILVIAGDICEVRSVLYNKFLYWCSLNWRYVIFITGNHEYYWDHELHPRMTPMSMDEMDNFIPQTVNKNVIFLQNGASFRLPGTNIRFVGTTLWSDIDPMIHDEIASLKGDYNATFTSTPTGIRKTTPADISALHALQKSYLASAIAPQLPTETLIVITHHMPSKHLLEPHFRDERWNSCYASNDDDLIRPNVKVWICGHSHRAIQWRAPSGTLVLMNARGYNSQDEQHRTEDIYSPTAGFDL